MGLVFLIGCDDPVSQNIARELERHSGLEMHQFCTLDEAMHELTAAKPTVVLVGPGEAPSEAIALSAFVQAHELDSAVILVAAQLDTSFLRSALRAGVTDVLASADGPEAAITSVLEADAATTRRRGGAASSPAATEKPKVGKVITVFSTKGGVGKSVLSTNVAAALASEYKKRTIILDLDLEFGDVSVMLQLKPARTIYDAAQSIDRLDAEMLKGFLIPHDSGLRALLAPIRPEEAESVTTVRIAQIIDLLKSMADYVVVDTPAALSEVVLTAVERSDVVLAVATLDVPSVKNTKVSLQKLHQLGMNGSSVKLVLNRADSKVWLEPQEIERALADKIVARIPSDRLVPRCVNKGVPVVLDSPRTAVARSISSLAMQVIEN